jgi:acylphosphatase
MARTLVIVTGRVQGVGFRWGTLEEAERLGLSGSVRNEPDGSVRVEVEGDRSGELIEWLRRGPPFARVESVELRDIPETGESGFKVG